MADASANKGTEGEDPSMEEILQSIRSIIAEDGEEGQPGSEKKDPNNPDGEVGGSDVLELTETEMVDEEAKPVEAKAGEATPQAPVVEKPVEVAAAVPAPEASADILNQIDDALTPDPAPVAAAAPAAPAAASKAAEAPGDALLSEQAAGAATSAIKKLQDAVEPPIPTARTTPSPAFQSGNTVEDMAAAMLRPMIKEWLDANLPKIVERIVTLEIRRLSK